MILESVSTKITMDQVAAFYSLLLSCRCNHDYASNE